VLFSCIESPSVAMSSGGVEERFLKFEFNPNSLQEVTEASLFTLLLPTDESRVLDHFSGEIKLKVISKQNRLLAFKAILDNLIVISHDKIHLV
jgi:hypothetical protein